MVRSDYAPVIHSLISVASAIFVISMSLSDFIVMEVLGNEGYIPKSPLPNVRVFTALSIAVFIHSKIGNQRHHPVEHFVNGIVHLVAAAMGFTAAVALGNPTIDEPQWFGYSIWIEIRGYDVNSHLFHIISSWFIASVILCWAAECMFWCIYYVYFDVGGEYKLPEYNCTRYIAIKQIVAILGCIAWLLSCVYDVAFHEFPSWQLIDSPMQFASIAILFSTLTWGDTSSPALFVGLLLDILGIITATVYIHDEIRLVDSVSRWADYDSYAAMFPVGATTSLSFGHDIVYRSNLPFEERFAAAFALYNVHTQIYRTILLSCCYADFIVHSVIIIVGIIRSTNHDKPHNQKIKE